MQAVYLARRGFRVHLFEARSDIRLEPRYMGLSINLALSDRGIAALERIEAAGPILAAGIPMHARMIHDLRGRKTSLPYGVHNEAIRSIDRRNLNEHLLTLAEGYEGVQIFFQHKLLHVDIKTNSCKFRR